MMDISALFGVIGVSLAVAFATEFIQYALIYRTSSFKSLKANLEKQAAQVEVARDASSSRGVKKREARLQGLEDEAGRQLAAANMKSGAIVRTVPPLLETPIHATKKESKLMWMMLMKSSDQSPI